MTHQRNQKDLFITFKKFSTKVKVQTDLKVTFKPFCEL